MKQGEAERGIRSFARDWCAYDDLEHYTFESIDDCYAKLSAQRPELLEFGSGEDIHLDREQLARAWIEEELDRAGQSRRLQRQIEDPRQ